MTAELSHTVHQHRPWRMPLDGPRRAAVERFETPRRWPWWLLDTVRAREQVARPEAIDALAEVSLPDQDGLPVRVRDVWRDGPAVIVWLRQFGCPFCRAYARELNRVRGQFTGAGARLVLIGQGTSEDAARFRRHFRIELQVLADADRVTYLWAGTKLATLDELVGPSVVGRALVRMARERVFIGHNTADEAQLGGSIVVSPTGRIAFSHISDDASDVAPPADLLAAVAAAGGRDAPGTSQPTDQAHGLV